MANKYEYFLRKLWEIKGAPQLLKDTISAALAVITADKVSDDRIKKRLEICGSCRFVVINKDDQLACGFCKCKITERHLLLNLALYEEDDSEKKLWGCHNPDHLGGSKWKAQNV